MGAAANGSKAEPGRTRPAANAWPWLGIAASLLAAALPSAGPADAVADDKPAAVTFLEQGWSPEIRAAFYHTPQGSRMIPDAWFMALEAPDGSGMMAEDAMLARYGLIPTDAPTPLNPRALPIGFAVDPVDVPGLGAHVGLTCAACHTAEITVEGRRVRIDGGAASFDFDRFYADLARAVERTLFDDGAFRRFAARLITEPTPIAAAELRLQLAQFQAQLAGDAAIRRPALESGFGRVDALTQILNALAAGGQRDPSNLRPARAPTSYPHLWLAPELEFVQWNPIAASPIGRNGGEVLGVFGSADLSGEPADWYRSTILLDELHALESWIADLAPPRWDETIFGPIDASLAESGRDLYRQHCDACHSAPPYRRTRAEENAFGLQFIEIAKIDYRAVGTDPTYVQDLERRLVRAGPAIRAVAGDRPLVPAAAFFDSAVGAVVGRALDAAGLGREERLQRMGYRLRPPAELGARPLPYAPTSITTLKAGPLAGIWASGPYLHNGSVATIYELLSPVAERRAIFWTGRRELDRERLGLVSDAAPGLFRFDTALPGNLNIGHVYPRQGLGHDERMALIEYLKTL